MHTRNGFTLVELLIVMVVLGILAAIAIPKYAETRDRAFVSSMKADLRNLSTQQELYHDDNTIYSSNLDELGARASQGVTLAVGVATNTGWSATTTHTASPFRCAIFYGDAAVVAPATTPGVVECAET